MMTPINEKDGYTASSMPYKIYTYEEIRRDKTKFDEVYQYVKMYGQHTIAYSTLQPKMNYFIIEGIGFIAYGKLNKDSRERFVLGDPICDKKNKEYLIGKYLKYKPKSYFIQVQDSTALLLNKNFNFYGTPMGIETSLDLSNFENEWRTFNWVGRKIRRGEKKIKVYESTELPNISKEQVEALSSQWLEDPKRGKKEISFLARPLKIDLPNARVFYSLKEDKLVGVTVFDPVFNEDGVINYSVNITRISNDAPDFTGDYSWYQALKKLKSEGCNALELGLSPLHNLEGDGLKIHDKLTLNFIKLINRVGKKLYNFDGLAYHKKNFKGKEKHVYICHKNRLAFIPVIKLLRLCNLI